MTQMSHLQFWRWYEKLAVPIPNDGSVQDMKLITFGGVGDLPTVVRRRSLHRAHRRRHQGNGHFHQERRLRRHHAGDDPQLQHRRDPGRPQSTGHLRRAHTQPRPSPLSSPAIPASARPSPRTARPSSTPTTATWPPRPWARTLPPGAPPAPSASITPKCNSGKKLAVFPKFLLVPDDLYDAALVITGYGEGMPTTYTPEAQARNAADPRPVVVVVPDWTDANDWAYLVDPQIYPVIQISYAQSPGGGTPSRTRTLQRHRRKPGPALHQRRPAHQGPRLVRRQRQRPPRHRQTQCRLNRSLISFRQGEGPD